MSSQDPFEYVEGRKLEITKEQEDEIKGFYQEALEELRREFKYYIRSESRYANYQVKYIKETKREIVEVMDYVDRRTQVTIENNMVKMSDVVLQANQMFLNNEGYHNYINNPAIKADVINRIVTGQIYGSEKYSLSNAIWGDNQRKIDEMYKIIAKDIAKNKSIYQISKDIERYVNPKARKDFEWNKMFPGSRKKVDYNAQRLARTMVQHAYQESIVAATINNPFVDAYKWITSGGHNVCPICMDRETLDEYGLGPGIFPKDELPLDHPNGMCTFELVMSMSDDEIQDVIADWYMGMGDTEMNEKLDAFAKYMENF